MNLDKVCVVSTDDPWKRGGVGGKATHLRLLLRGLSEAGISSELVTASETALFRLTRDLSGLFIRSRLKDKEKRYEHYLAQYSAHLQRYLRKAALDSPVINPHDVLAARDLGSELTRNVKEIPTVLTLHGYFTREASSTHELREGSPAFERYERLEKLVYEHATRIVCVDSRIRDYVLGMADLPPDRVAVLPNAVDTGAFKPTTAEPRDRARRAIGVRDSETVVLCPRRLVAKNGVEFAVRAISLMTDTQDDTRLVIAGDGPERARIEKLVRELGLQARVLLAGSVPHDRMSRLYSASDIVLIPSISSVGVQEATSLSMLEGMAASLPVIVTGIGGLKETIRHEETGLVVDEADPAAIASALTSLAADKFTAARLGANARKYVVKHHSYLAHSRSMIAEYEKALR